MRYKNNVLEKLNQTDAVAKRIHFEISRGIITQDALLESVEMLKEQIEGIREMISVEPVDFEQQFRG